MKNHCKCSQYMFQVKKCTDASCLYCVQHPVHLHVQKEVFDSLSYLPLPLFDNTKEHYQKFFDIYGQDPSDKDRPSLIPCPSEEAKQVDKGRKSLLVWGKVRGAIVCGECHKPKCIYSKTKLSHEQSTSLDIIIESDWYTCGASLFASDTPYTGTIVVREALVCSSCIETQYYSSVLPVVHFPPACYYCGVPEEALVNDDTIQELKNSYAVVYPICLLCLSDRKKPHCKQPSNMAK